MTEERRMNKLRQTIAIAVVAAVAISLLSACAEIPPLTDGELSKRLEFNCSFDFMEAGESRRYYVKVKPEGSLDDVTFSSSDESVASVDEEGVVTALKAGEVTIFARSKKAMEETSLELTVYDAIVFSSDEDGEEALASAASSEVPISLALNGKFLVPVYVNGDLTIESIGGAELCGVKIEDGGSLCAKSIAFASSDDGICVETGEGASFAAEGCTFKCDRAQEASAACAARRGFESLILDECEFSGFATAVSISPSDGRAEVFNNVFAECEVAIEADVALPEVCGNAALSGRIEDNIFVACGKTLNFRVYGKYDGELKTEEN